MGHELIFSRSFSEQELKKLGCAALILCFITIFSLCNIFMQSGMNLELQVTLGLKLLSASDKINEAQETYFDAGMVTPIYNWSNSRSDVFKISSDIRIQGNSSTIFIASTTPKQNPHYFTSKPYARKMDVFVMQYVKNWKITHPIGENSLNCSQSFSIPAILFSTGGYSLNHFHDFTDLLIPLYLTSKPFDGNVLFLITDKRYSWISKYELILKKLSNHHVMDIDKEKQVLCFSRLVFGLESHKEFGINPSKFPHYSIGDFRQFLRSTFSLDRESINDKKITPQMLIVSRKNTRLLKNEGEVGDVARGLGFEVVVSEIAQNMSIVAKFVNSFDVIMGVHGAGLTNMIFLPDNAVVIEIVPFGLENLARPYFKIPAKDMRLRYLEYKVSLNESSLLGKYSADSEVYRNPGGLQKKGFLGFRSVYLDNQDVNLDCGRFRETLIQALEIIKSL